jgi:hypothetical protein
VHVDGVAEEGEVEAEETAEAVVEGVQGNGDVEEALAVGSDADEEELDVESAEVDGAEASVGDGEDEEAREDEETDVEAADADETGVGVAVAKVAEVTGRQQSPPLAVWLEEDNEEGNDALADAGGSADASPWTAALRGGGRGRRIGYSW